MSLITKIFKNGNGNGNGKKRDEEELQQFRLKAAFGQVIDEKVKPALDTQAGLLTEIRDDLRLALLSAVGRK